MLALWLGTAVGKDVHKAWPRSFMVRPIWREALLALSEYGRALLYGEARRAFEEARKRFEAAGDRERSEAVARELESVVSALPSGAALRSTAPPAPTP